MLQSQSTSEPPDIRIRLVIASFALGHLLSPPMKAEPLRIILLAILLASGSTPAATLYVDAASTNAVAPYTNWLTAAAVIQDAVDASAPGDEVVVTNGVYARGGRAVIYGSRFTTLIGSLTNRVAVDKPITLRSVNGPEVTIIQGYQVPNITNGDGAVRCVYLTNGAVLSGFTLTNGATQNKGSSEEEYGGGVWCESNQTVITNCALSGNAAYRFGGGADKGTLNNCTLQGNWSGNGGGGARRAILNYCTLSGNRSWDGGGVIACTLNHCTIIGNLALGGMGGGAHDCTLNNCLLTGNRAYMAVGGTWAGSLINGTVTGNTAMHFGGCYDAKLTGCIVYYNTSRFGSPYQASGTLIYCCTTPDPGWGAGNITNEPLFMDRLHGNLRLQSNSPCINSGCNAYVTNRTDLDGRSRISGGTVDIGAYEF